MSNSATKLMMEYSDVHVIAGMNQSMVMDFVLSDEANIATRIKNAIQVSKDSMSYINELPEIIQTKAQSQSDDANDSQLSQDFF